MLLLLLHGVGGNGRLWDGVVSQTSLATFAPDLAGHGSAPVLPRYTFGHYREELLERVGPTIGTEPVVVLGHSMGGALGVTLAADPGPLDIRGVVGIGIKAQWTPEEKASLHRIADKGVAWFDSEAEARERFIKVSGLAGMVAPEAAGARQGVCEEGGRWRLAADPEVYRVEPDPLAPQIASADCPVVLAAGENDAMSPPHTLEGLGARVFTLNGAGHNAHVEQPTAALRLLDELGIEL